MQLDNMKRGFSYKSSSNLDMRFDINQKISAFNIVNDTSSDKLADIIITMEKKGGLDLLPNALQ